MVFIKFDNRRFRVLSGSLLCCLLGSNQVSAEIIPDNTLPVNSTVTSEGSIRAISGGTQRGSNLFHSFQEFNLPTGGEAHFNNDLAIRNIVTRVTGNKTSNIDGLIRAHGRANLFLLNPNGIIFGPAASLNVGGSFVASTASSLKFADGVEFSATAPQESPLLTISVPTGLQFGDRAGAIVNQSQARPNAAVNIFRRPVGLQLKSGRTLALVGSGVEMLWGNLRVEGGRVELGSVAGPGLVRLNEIDFGYFLDYTNINNFQDINLSRAAIIDVSGSTGGDIRLQGSKVSLANSFIASVTQGSGVGRNIEINARTLTVGGGSQVLTSTRSQGSAGDVLVTARDSVEIAGLLSAVGSQVEESATGNGGDVKIDTKQLRIQNGAILDASTFGAGKAGDIQVTATESVELETNQNNQPSLIAAQVAKEATDNPGDAGNIDITTGKLSIQDGAQISASARKSGNGGNITINADLIELSGSLPNATLTGGSSGIFVAAEPPVNNIVTSGNAGDLFVNAREVIVKEGAKISANNYGTGLGGSLTFNIGRLLIQNGGLVTSSSFDGAKGGNLNVNARQSVEVIGAGKIGQTDVDSGLLTEARSSNNQQASGNAGDLNVNTSSLKVRDGAKVSVSNQYQQGNAGNLIVKAELISLDNRGSLSGTTDSGNGGDITLFVQNLLRLNSNSQISTTAGNANAGGNGGNITINTTDGFIVARPLSNSDITANAFNGRGGKVTINATSIFGIAPLSRQDLERLRPQDLDPRQLPTNDITAISRTNPSLSGVVTINTPDVDPSRGLVELPNNFVDPSSLVSTACVPRDGFARSSFTITGRGGMSPSPYWPLQNLDAIARWIPLNPKNSHQARIPQPPKAVSTWTLVEASGWVVDANRSIHLVAQAPQSDPPIPWSTSSCF